MSFSIRQLKARYQVIENYKEVAKSYGHERYRRYLRWGHVPYEWRNAFADDIQLIVDNYNDEPLDFVSWTSLDTYFAKYPNRVVAEAKETTSLHFPIEVKGTREQVEAVINQIFTNASQSPPDPPPDPAPDPAPEKQERTLDDYKEALEKLKEHAQLKMERDQLWDKLNGSNPKSKRYTQIRRKLDKVHNKLAPVRELAKENEIIAEQLDIAIKRVTGKNGLNELDDIEWRSFHNHGEYLFLIEGENGLRKKVEALEKEKAGGKDKLKLKKKAQAQRLRLLITREKLQSGGKDPDKNLKPPVQSKKAQLTPLQKVEKRIRKNKHESIHFFDGRDGKEVFSKRGKNNGVSLSIPELRKGQGRVVTHNHPNMLRDIPYIKATSSFSLPDIMTAVKADFKEMRAVGPDGRTYIFYNIAYPHWGTKEGAKEIGDIYEKHYLNVKDMFWAYLDSVEEEYGKESNELEDAISEAEAKTRHYIMLRLIEDPKLAGQLHYELTTEDKT